MIFFVLLICVMIAIKVAVEYSPQFLKKQGIVITNLDVFLTFQSLKFYKKMKDLFLREFQLDLNCFGWNAIGFLRIQFSLHRVVVKLVLNEIELNIMNNFAKFPNDPKKVEENVQIIKKFIENNFELLTKKRKPKKVYTEKQIQEISIFKVILNFSIRILMILLLKRIKIKIDEIELQLYKNETQQFIKIKVEQLFANINYLGDENFLFQVQIQNISFAIYKNNKEISKLCLEEVTAKYKIPAAHNVIFSITNSVMVAEVQKMWGNIRHEGFYHLMEFPLRFICIQKARKLLRTIYGIVDYKKKMEKLYLDIEDIELVNQKASTKNRYQNSYYRHILDV